MQQTASRDQAQQARNPSAVAAGRLIMRAMIMALSMVAMLATANSAKADRRIAFVCGNGAYKNMPRLANASISAKAMVGLLKGAGFEVVQGFDLTRDKMTEHLLEFGKKAQGADVALFYYSGRGIAVNGTEYLLPINANIKSEMDITLGGAINLNLSIDQTMGDAKVKLVFLDASRDNPLAAATSRSHSVSIKSGLAEMKPPDNTMMVFATGPGQAAPDGPTGTVRPFTRALIANIAAPGVEIQQAMTKVRAQLNQDTKGQQNSWGHSDISGDVYLNPAASPANAPASAK
jgi:uncharacterized caspase-like protein